MCNKLYEIENVKALAYGQQQPNSVIIALYNMAFVNSERRLANSRVDITHCQHGKFSAACKHGNFSYPSGF